MLRLRTPAFICVLLVLLSAPVLWIVSDSSSECERRSEWLQSNRHELPVSYEELVAFPVEYRRAIMSTYDAETKLRMWRTHLDAMMAAPETSVSERALLLQISQALRSDMFARPLPVSARGELRELEQIAKSGLSAGRALSALAIMGPADPVGWTWAAARVRAIAKLRSAFALSAMAPDCSCSRQSDWCMPLPTSPTSECQTKSCQILGDECGTLWTYDCDGMCSGGN